MAVDPVPAVVHGAKHSADVFRQWIDNSTGGAEGVSSPTSLNVRATGTPSGQVRVAPGGALIPNSYTGGSGQSYTGRNASETLVNVPASDSTGAKSWHIIFRVQDPQFGGPSPADAESGPYSFIECVSTSAIVSDPHYVLAEVVVPKSTSAIESSMITDSRELAQPGRWPLMLGRPLTAMDTDQKLDWTVADGGEFFPGGGGSFNSFEVYVPKRATAIQIQAEWVSVLYGADSNPYGEYWVEYGDEYKPHTWPRNRQYEYGTQKFAFNSPGTSNDKSRMNWPLYSTQTIPKKYRGKTITIAFKAGRLDSGAPADVSMDKRSGLGANVTFVETIQSVDQDEAA